ncbi:TetR family transcriptional regulator [Streptomyces alkaliphilus]|uniref:TetR family transcriptional regulator n=1 Tax=Streptomyces alkaliphilus TaxID=1472722 RepID=A0A7W3T9Q8_9ACTN|nr:ScbR family autoregulator-binding transcription factor [Streptomyces alkaliphilus]MBB0242869.1 TetR family transcriptional regulator [Streptomyces alkaliphilus]
MADPKQERAVKTRKVILHAAAEVFDQWGYSGASISKIMARAGVTQGAMYFHFKSKQELAQAVMASQQEFVEFPPGEFGLQRMIDLTFYLAHELQTNVLVRASVRLAVEQGEFGVRDDTVYQEWADQLLLYLRSARERGELLPEVDEQEFAQMLVGAYGGTQLHSHISTNRADLPQRVASLWRYLLPGLAPEHVRSHLRIEPLPNGVAA